MRTRRFVTFFIAIGLTLATGSVIAEEKTGEPYKPYSGQPGKDVVWVPTPDSMVEKMLDIAGVTPKDRVIDLGSGDGRNVIAAAKRGATALGVEYNDKLVMLSRELAAKEGVSDKASFVQGDMYVADVSKANVLVLFLLTENLNKLVPNFLKMEPGSRIVINTFRISGWEPDYTETANPCTSWCTVFLHIVPAKVDGSWKMGRGTLRLEQSFQMLDGVLSAGGNEAKLSDGRLRGSEISFAIDGVRYEGRVEGDKMTGEIAGKPGTGWTATRER